MDCFSQSKKEQILILNNRIDSLINSNRMLRHEIDSMTTVIKGKSQQIKDCSHDLSKSHFDFEQLQQVRKSDSISHLAEIEKHIKVYKALRDSLKQSAENLSKWINKNLNILIPEEINNFKIVSDLTPNIKETLLQTEYWLKTKQVQEIKNNGFYISINLSDDDYSKKLFISNKYLIVSYHLTMGSEGGSILIDLNTMKETSLPGYYISSMESDFIIKVEKDYYDKNGHVWEYGTYNIQTGVYKFISKEY
jgi:hypothetical protein